MRQSLYLLYLCSTIFLQFLLPCEVYRNAKVFAAPKNLSRNWKWVVLQDHHILREFAATLICRYFLSLWLLHSPTIMHDIRWKINVWVNHFIFFLIFSCTIFTWIQNSSDLANASCRYCLSGWSIGVCSKIYNHNMFHVLRYDMM